MSTRHFGVSTDLYRRQRLTRDHLAAIGAHGFTRVQLCAVRTHLDYHNPSALGDLQQWMAEAGLELESVHAPCGEGFSGGRWSAPLSLASTDRHARERAVAETERALHIARRIPFRVLIAHLGWPRPAENSRDAARRSVEELLEAAAPLGVTLAVEVMRNELSRPASLVHFIEKVLDSSGAGICLDCGHAHADGDLLDTIEAVSEHLVAVEVNDSTGRSDNHLVPFDGSIDWPAALTQIQKVGYDGTLIFELESRGPAVETVRKARKARERMERLMA